MAYFKAYQREKDGKTHVWYYRGKKLWFHIVPKDDGWYHALTDIEHGGGSLVPTLELAKQSIEERIRLLDDMTGKKSRITYDYGIYGTT